MNEEETEDPGIQKTKKLIISNFVVIMLLGIVMLILLNLTFTVQEESFMCMSDPLGYGAKKLSEVNNAEFSCTCGLNTASSPIIFFNQYGKEITYPTVAQYSDDYTLNFNFSDLLEN